MMGEDDARTRRWDEIVKRFGPTERPNDPPNA